MSIQQASTTRPDGTDRTAPAGRYNLDGHIAREQRFQNGRRCPICGGADNDRRGQGKRCSGFLSTDGQYCHCSREEFAGQSPLHTGSRCYMHRLKGKCPCGKEHAPADPKPSKAKNGRGTIEVTYAYRDEQGNLLFECVRYRDPKGFAQRRPDDNGRYVWNLRGVCLVPYLLPELLAADPAEWVLVAEGEKDVERLMLHGFVATCNPMGAGKWRAEYVKHLAGRKVVIIPDNDQAGRDHAQQVARSLSGEAAEVKVLELPGLPEKGDVSDWLDRGGTCEELGRLIYQAPLWTPPQDPVVGGNGRDGGNHATANGTPDWTDDELGLIRLASVEIVPLEWLWPNRVPLGKITVVAGDGGVGKSFMTLAWAAVVSRGAVWPDAPSVPVPAGHVILLSAEDDLADTVAPRLKAMGADLERIDSLGTGKTKKGTPVPFTIDDMGRLDEVMRRRPDTRLIVIDPITAYLPRGCDDNKNSELRAVLGPLAEFAGRHRVALVCVTHFSKNTSARAAARVIGSVAYSNAARATWCVAMDPGKDGRRLLMPVKTNLPPDRSSMAFTIIEGQVVWEPQPVKLDVNQVLSGPPSPAAAARQQRFEEAVEWLKEILANGPLPWAELFKRARRAGYSRELIKRARGKAGARVTKKGKDEGWVWELKVSLVS
jgi:hypothetical protein